MPGVESETGRQEGGTGKLIEGSCGGPTHDPVGYMETILEYHLPGLDHRRLSDEEFARKIAHLNYILQRELPADEHE